MTCPWAFFFAKPFSGIDGQIYTFRSFRGEVRDSRELAWKVESSIGSGAQLEVDIRGRKGFVHLLPYLKTDCSEQFEVANDSLAQARIVLRYPSGTWEELTTDTSAVLEMAGKRTAP